MTDTSKREKAESLVSAWLNGRITNWEFEDTWPHDSKDQAVVDIGRALWSFYSDFPSQTLSTSKLPQETVDLLRRCSAFLKSNQEYAPVTYREVIPWRPTWLTRLLRVKERPWETMAIDLDAERRKWWPFADQEHYLAAQQSGNESTDRHS